MHVTKSRLRVKQFTLIVQQKSAAGVLVAKAMKAQTVGSDKRTQNSMSDKRQKNQLALVFTEEGGVKLRDFSGRDRIAHGGYRCCRRRDRDKDCALNAGASVNTDRERTRLYMPGWRTPPPAPAGEQTSEEA